jgi:aspartyl/asparaginyl beta-hydroxylase (cupin superfamily)
VTCNRTTCFNSFNCLIPILSCCFPRRRRYTPASIVITVITGKWSKVRQGSTKGNASNRFQTDFKVDSCKRNWTRNYSSTSEGNSPIKLSPETRAAASLSTSPAGAASQFFLNLGKQNAPHGNDRIQVSGTNLHLSNLAALNQDFSAMFDYQRVARSSCCFSKTDKMGCMATLVGK